MGKFLKRYIIIMICFMLYFTCLPAYKFYKTYDVNKEKLSHINEVYEILKIRTEKKEYLTDDEEHELSVDEFEFNFSKKSEKYILSLINGMVYKFYLMGEALVEEDKEKYKLNEEIYNDLDRKLSIMLDYYNNEN